MTRAIRLLAVLSGGACILTIAAFLLGGAALEQWAAERLASPESRASAAVLIFALLAGDIVLPVPSSLTALAAGTLFGAATGTLIAGAGLSAGALAGAVVARRLGKARIRAHLGAEEFARLEAKLERYAALVVLLARPVPVLAETSVLVAGACGVRPAILAGPILFGSFAMAGAYAGLGAQAHDAQSFLLLFVASCVLPLVAWIALTRFRR